MSPNTIFGAETYNFPEEYHPLFQTNFITFLNLEDLSESAKLAINKTYGPFGEAV